jgi:hypothetical protein
MKSHVDVDHGDALRLTRPNADTKMPSMPHCRRLRRPIHGKNMTEFFFLLFLTWGLPVLAWGVTLLVASGSLVRRAAIAFAVASCIYIGLRLALPYAWQAARGQPDSVRLF